MSRVTVVGSVNVDSTSYVEMFPAPGETISSVGFQTALGGKGANQAVAAHRAGATTRFMARVGADPAGEFALERLRASGLDTADVTTAADAATGVAQITVADGGENTIIVSAGANATLTADDVDAAVATFDDDALVLTQGEVPARAVERLAAVCAGRGIRFMLNLAPPIEVSDETIAVCDPLVVNEHEAAAIGLAPDAAADDAASWQRVAAAAVAAKRCRSIVVTLGSAGAVFADASGAAHLGAPRVDAIDATGAGDAFTGVLAAFLAEGRELAASARLAVAAGALAVQRRGALDAYAMRDELLAAARDDVAGADPGA